MSVSSDGRSVFFLRSKAIGDPTLCLWKIDTGTGTEMLLACPASISNSDAAVPAAELARRERARESADGIVSYALGLGGSIAVFSLGGSIYTVDTANGAVRSMATADGVFDPRLNAAGTHIAYVSDQTLRITSIGPGSVDQELKADDDPLVSWGRAEFIAGEEMNRTRGFWWNPDSTSLLVAKVDESPIEKRWISDPANPDREPVQTRYPEAGTANAKVELALVNLDGSTSMIDWSEGKFEYMSNVIWSAGHPPLVVRQTRDQRTLSIAQIDLANQSVRELHLVTNEHWVELAPGSPTWSSAGLLTIEDHTASDTRVLCLNGDPISPTGTQVRSIVGIRGDEVVVTGSQDPTEIQVLAIPFPTTSASSAGSARLITSEPGVHGAVLGGPTTVVSSSSPTSSGVKITISTEPDQRHSDWLSIESFAQPPVLHADPTYLSLGDRDLRAALFLPQGHDGKSSLPVLLDPYGGPHAQRVLKAQNSHLVSQWFADQGFAVLVVDGRGTPGRGPAFEREVWGDLARPVLDDQIDALDAAAQQFGFLDLDRVGIRGWSFGGYLSALAVMRRPDRVHAAIAGAPVTTWRLYDTHYTERYLGHPAEFPHHYDQSDLLLEADQLASPLLLIHGLADDNVVAAHTLRLSSALLGAGRPHQVLPLSGVTHMTPQEIVAENLLLLQRDFLRDHLGSNDPKPS